MIRLLGVINRDLLCLLRLQLEIGNSIIIVYKPMVLKLHVH
jgi:hypothetical protein